MTYDTTDTKVRFTGKYYDGEDVSQYYFGARYLNGLTNRFNSVDPAAGKYPGWSPYVYAKCNPVRYTDPNGNWPEDVHHAKIDDAYSGGEINLTLNQIKYVKIGNDFIDNNFQKSEDSFMHGMRDGTGKVPQTIEEAQALTEKFIADNLDRFNSLQGDERFIFLGMASQAVTDPTSPSHEGTQAWKGLSNPLNWPAGAKHGWKERGSKLTPGREAAMVKALQELYKKAQEQKEKQDQKKKEEEEKKKWWMEDDAPTEGWRWGTDRPVNR